MVTPSPGIRRGERVPYYTALQVRIITRSRFVSRGVDTGSIPAFGIHRLVPRKHTSGNLCMSMLEACPCFRSVSGDSEAGVPGTPLGSGASWSCAPPHFLALTPFKEAKPAYFPPRPSLSISYFLRCPEWWQNTSRDTATKLDIGGYVRYPSGKH